MALATPDVHEALVAVRQAARSAERVAAKLPERFAWLVLLAAVGVAIVVASRLPVSDPVLRRLAQAPVDDEPNDPAEDADVASARGEGGIPWEQAKRQLHEAD